MSRVFVFVAAGVLAVAAGPRVRRWLRRTSRTQVHRITP